MTRKTKTTLDAMLADMAGLDIRDRSTIGHDDGSREFVWAGGLNHASGQNRFGRANYDGGNKDDDVNGTKGADNLDGGNGNDTLSGGRGADELDGGTGNDTLDGGTGNDNLNGGGGDDIIYGGSGRNRIDGGKGSDTIHVGEVDPQVAAGSGFYRAYVPHSRAVVAAKGGVGEGGGGDDTIFGSFADDSLNGQGGNDTLIGGDGNDDLKGGDGDDTLYGGPGFDRLYGGKGRDVFVFNAFEKQGDNISTAVADAMAVIFGFTGGEDKIDLSALQAELNGHSLSLSRLDGTTGEGPKPYSLSYGVYLIGDGAVALFVIDTDGQPTSSEYGFKIFYSDRDYIFKVSDFILPPKQEPTITSTATASVAEITGTFDRFKIIYSATATDDQGDTITWSIEGTDKDKFTIGSASGDLRLNAAPDFEKQQSYSLILVANDGKGNTTKQDLVLTVVDVNEAPDLPAGATLSVAENANGVIYTAVANDPDKGDTKSWSLFGTDADDFEIDANGAIRFKKPPNFESADDDGKDNVYALVIRVTDKAGLSDLQVLTVTVTNIADIAPDTTSPTSTNSKTPTFSGTATLSAGETLSVTVTGPNSYSKTYTNVIVNNGTWSILSDALPGDATYTVRATIQDAATNTSIVDAMPLKVTVDSVKPVITAPATIEMNENVKDVSPNIAANEAVTWGFDGGVDDGKFTIGTDGKLSFNNAPNYENPGDNGKDNIYNVKIKATDAAGNFETKDIAITVKNIADVAPDTTDATNKDTKTPTFSGTAQLSAGETLSVTVTGPGGYSKTYNNVPVSNGTWSQVSEALPAIGKYTVTAKVTHAATNTSISDGTPFEVEITTPQPTDYAIGMLGDDITAGVGLVDPGGFTTGLMPIFIGEGMTGGSTVVTIMASNANDPNYKDAGKAFIVPTDPNGFWTLDLSDADKADLGGGPGTVYTVKIDIRDNNLSVVKTATQSFTLVSPDAQGLVTGSAVADYLEAGQGGGTLNGLAGQDTLVGSALGDTLNGGAGDDALYGNAEADTLDGGTGTDLLVGGAGDDGLSGGDGEDNLTGEDGDDNLTGGADADLLEGGDGADKFIFAAGDSGSTLGQTDLVKDFVTGTDKIGTAIANVNLKAVDGSGLFDLAAFVAMIDFSNGVEAYAAYNVNGITGYLALDTNQNGSFDSGTDVIVELFGYKTANFLAQTDFILIS